MPIRKNPYRLLSKSTYHSNDSMANSIVEASKKQALPGIYAGFMIKFHPIYSKICSLLMIRYNFIETEDSA